MVCFLPGNQSIYSVDRYTVPCDIKTMMKMNQEITTSQETAVISITPEHREEILQTISDMSKDATGSRLRYDYEAMSDAELLSMVEYFADQIDENNMLQASEEAEALAGFETFLTGLMSEYGISKATALRWDMEAEDAPNRCDQDVEHYLWNKRIGFGDMAPYKELAKQFETPWENEDE